MGRVVVVVPFFFIHFFSVSNPIPERRKELGLRRAKLGLRPRFGITPNFSKYFCFLKSTRISLIVAPWVKSRYFFSQLNFCFTVMQNLVTFCSQISRAYSGKNDAFLEKMIKGKKSIFFFVKKN